MVSGGSVGGSEVVRVDDTKLSRQDPSEDELALARGGRHLGNGCEDAWHLKHNVQGQ